MNQRLPSINVSRRWGGQRLGCAIIFIAPHTMWLADLVDSGDNEVDVTGLAEILTLS